MRSMTAYAKATKHTPFGILTLEVHSINRKSLDIFLSLPKEMLKWDIEMRKWVSRFVRRGNLTLRLGFQPQEDRAWHIKAEELKRYKSEWISVAQKLGFEAEKTITLPFLVEQYQKEMRLEPEVEEEALQTSLKALCEEALTLLVERKVQEGEFLSLEMLKKLSTIEEIISVFSKHATHAPQKHFHLLKERIQNFLKHEGLELKEEDLYRECAILTEKLDFTEELERLCSHCNQFKKIAASSEVDVGKSLDFLVQEMHREMNTLGVKASDAEISHLVVKGKSELEKMREQLQNIE